MLHKVKEPTIDYNPPAYICKRSELPYPGEPDGKLDKPFWNQAGVIDKLTDIEGGHMHAPYKNTSIRMLWDEDNLYVGAKLEENDIWATVKGRDEIVFFDNDFEIFLSPKHTTHRYYEIEMNALNTIWDLLMIMPVRDGVHRIYAWDIRGLKTAVHIEGELNNPKAENKYWSLEAVIPWYSLREADSGDCLIHRLAPIHGEYWRVNFSRVEYRTEISDGRYVKTIDPETGKAYPEHNWVWAPTGAIDIHMPEMWGYVMFAERDEPFAPPPRERVLWELRKLYYRQRNYGAENGAYTEDFRLLRGTDIWTIDPKIGVTPNMFEISAESDGQKYYIRQDGYVWIE